MFANQRNAQLVVVIRMLIGLTDIFVKHTRQKWRVAMQIVIDIPKEHFKKICANKEDAIIAHDTCRRIANGTVLPEHGRLIDADAYKKNLKWNENVDNAPTILEANFQNRQ